MSDRLRILVVLGDGGHSAEILRLIELLGPEYEYAYVVTYSDRISEGKVTIPGQMYRVMRPRAKDDNAWMAALKLVQSFWQALRLWRRLRPDAILGSGPAVMVPVAVIGKVLGSKVIFVETGSRVSELSLTGKIMLKVADLFFVQWEQLQNRYPQTIFAGRLF